MEALILYIVVWSSHIVQVQSHIVETNIIKAHGHNGRPSRYWGQILVNLSFFEMKHLSPYLARHLVCQERDNQLALRFLWGWGDIRRENLIIISEKLQWAIWLY